MGRALKYLGITIAGLLIVVILAVAGTGLWIYLKPHSAWQLAEKHYLPADLKIHSETYKVAIDHIAFLTWRISADFKDVVVIKGSPKVNSHIDIVSIAARISVFSPSTSLEIEHFTLLAKKVPSRITAQKSAPDEEALSPGEWLEKVDSFGEMLARWNEQVRIGKVNVEIDEIRYDSGDATPISSGFKLHKDCLAACPIQFSIQVNHLSQLISKLEFAGSGDLALYSTGKEFLKANLTANGKDLAVRFPFSASQVNRKFVVKSNADIVYHNEKTPIHVQPKLKITGDSKNIDLSILASVAGLPGPLATLPEIRAEYHLPVSGGETWFSNKSHLEISSPLPLFFITPKRHAQFEKSCSCKIARTQNISIKADLWLSRLLTGSSKKEVALVADIRAQKIENKLFVIDFGATFKMYHGVREWLFEPTVDSSASFYSFQALQKIFAAYGVMVPAPLSVLEGKLDLEAKSPITFERNDGKWSAVSAIAKLKANLKSPRQKVNLSTELTAKASANFKNIDFLVKAKIDDLQLELPPLNPVSDVPRVALDPRIQQKPIAKKSPFKVTFGFEIDTSKPGAIRLLIPLADPYIPLTIHLESRNAAKSDDFLKIEPFEIKYLRRTVAVNFVKINLNETKNGDFPLEARLHVQQTDYKVFISVVGTTGSPKIDLTSEPYLEYDDIISVLLYDKPRDQLAAGDAETSSNVQAAIADRALGLFGLWAFAATPIRSFTYNPVNKAYTATIVLDKGVTAGFGTSTDKNASFELRKRLSKKWVIAASWAQTTEQENAGQVVLQWEERF